MKNIYIIFIALFAAPLVATADDVVIDDQIVSGSQCVGLDCINGEVFGFDTLRLKENNTRLKFQDTSSSASFPTTDWQIIANEARNGGENYLAFECVDRGVMPLIIEQDAPDKGLVVHSRGIAHNTNVAQANAHFTDGDTPTIRLQQDGSVGWAPVHWDMGGNEVGFFIRNSANALPLRVMHDTPNEQLVVANGGVGIGVKPTHNLDISDIDPSIRLNDSQADNGWTFSVIEDGQRVLLTNSDTGLGIEVTSAGDVIVDGEITSRVPEEEVPDYVFAPNYKMMSLDAVESHIQKKGHLPGIPSAKRIASEGLHHKEFQLRLLEKVEELTLHTIAQEKRLHRLERENERLKKSQKK